MNNATAAYDLRPKRRRPEGGQNRFLIAKNGDKNRSAVVFQVQKWNPWRNEVVLLAPDESCLGRVIETDLYETVESESSFPPSEAPEQTEDDAVTGLLVGLEHLTQRGMVDEAIDRVIEFFEDAMSEGDWLACRFALLRAPIARLDVAVSLAFLSMTFIERDRLAKARAVFYRRIESHLVSTLGREAAAKHLHGLQ